MIPAGPPYSSAIQTNERKINFMRHRNIMVLVAAFLALAASRAEAIIINYFPVGISLGQSARLNLANIGETRGIIINYRFLDSDGVVIAQERALSVPLGEMVSVDLNRDVLSRTEPRIQIRAEVEILSSGNPRQTLRQSLEVFDNATGKTTVGFVEPPDPD